MKFKKQDVGGVATEWVARQLSGISVPVLRGRFGDDVVLDPKVLVRVLGYRKNENGYFFVIAQDPTVLHAIVSRVDLGVKLYSEPVDGAGKLTAMYAWRFRDHPNVAHAFEGSTPAVDTSRFPHKCGCGAPAYRGFNSIECSATACAGRP